MRRDNKAYKKYQSKRWKVFREMYLAEIICRLYVENVIPKKLQWKMAVLETEKNLYQIKKGD